MTKSLNDQIKDKIIEFVALYQKEKQTTTAWGEPLVGFADTADPLFLQLKEAVSPSHSMPADLLPDTKSVIAYFIPFVKEIPKSNRKGIHASEQWALGYIETNQLIVDLNHHLVEFLGAFQFHCANLPPTHNFDKKKLMSDWSHRHIAYIAGMGKFGVHKLLITEKGCCGRFGSLITTAKLEATKRLDIEYCLYNTDHSCLVCVKNCKVEALTIEGYDRHRCYQMCLENNERLQGDKLADVCGKCISIVPCSFKNPVRS